MIPNARQMLTPKQLADAIGVSESSLRRWVDAGDIRIARTAGGHRRIPLGEAIRFIRKLKVPVLRPDLLGLGEMAAGSYGSARDPDEDRLFAILETGDSAAVRLLLISWYLEGRTLPDIFDGPMKGALYRLGELWQHNEQGILIEHRASEICCEAIATLRGLLPPVAPEAPLAIGGGPEGDPYLVPTMMAGAALAEIGFRDMNCGANTPVGLLSRAAIERGASLVWISISASMPLLKLPDALQRLVRELSDRPTHVVMGGRNHAPYVQSGLGITLRHSMRELADLGRKIMGENGRRLAQSTP